MRCPDIKRIFLLSQYHNGNEFCQSHCLKQARLPLLSDRLLNCRFSDPDIDPSDTCLYYSLRYQLLHRDAYSSVICFRYVLISLMKPIMREQQAGSLEVLKINITRKKARGQHRGNLAYALATGKTARTNPIVVALIGGQPLYPSPEASV